MEITTRERFIKKSSNRKQYCDQFNFKDFTENCVDISIQNPTTLKFKVNRVGICNFTTTIKDGLNNKSVDFSLNFINSRPIARNSNFTIQLNETIKGFTINFTPLVSDVDGDPLIINQFSYHHQLLQI